MSLRRDRSERLHPMGCGLWPLDPEGARFSGPGSLNARFRATKTGWSFLSVVIPAKNEAASLPQLIDETVGALRPLCESAQRELVGFEIIVVDDASEDSTQSVLRNLIVANPELKVVLLANSAGQSAATMAGIHVATGEWIATMDADLQNKPADLVRLWRALPGDGSAVLGWRVRRQDIWSKRIISFWANRFRNKVLRQSIRDTGCSVRIFPRTLALRLPMFHGMHRFFGSLLLREGCNIIQLPVHHRARHHGRSHYNLRNRSLQVAIDLLGVAWLTHRPLHGQAIQVWDATRASDELMSVT